MTRPHSISPGLRENYTVYVCFWHLASFRYAAKLGRYWRHSGHCSALAHIANSGIFPAQSLKQGTKCRISTARA